jgi:hypothetical protein
MRDPEKAEDDQGKDLVTEAEILLNCQIPKEKFCFGNAKRIHNSHLMGLF